MKDTPVLMVRDNLDDIPSHPLPRGFRIRRFERGDEHYWAEVEHSAGEFESREAALARFLHDFGDHLAEVSERCFFVVDDETSRVVGTATAWYDLSFRGENHGRVHWVAVMPEFQGRKLAKPLMSVVMERLRQSHDRAYLKTHTKCVRAIRMYLELGFRPWHEYPTCDEAWRYLARVIDHHALNAYRGSAT